MRKEDAFKVLGLTGTVSMKEIKTAYRRLANKYHPDKNPAGSEMMKVINAAYEALGKLDYSQNIETGETEASDYVEVLSEMFGVIITLEDITVEVCGSWIWISGNTKAFKDQLKALGCKYSGKKKMWYMKPAGEKRKGWRGGEYSIEDIRERHGSAVVRGKAQPRVK